MQGADSSSHPFRSADEFRVVWPKGRCDVAEAASVRVTRLGGDCAVISEPNPGRFTVASLRSQAGVMQRPNVVDWANLLLEQGILPGPGSLLVVRCAGSDGAEAYFTLGLFFDGTTFHGHRLYPVSGRIEAGIREYFECHPPGSLTGRHAARATSKEPATWRRAFGVVAAVVLLTGFAMGAAGWAANEHAALTARVAALEQRARDLNPDQQRDMWAQRWDQLQRMEQELASLAGRLEDSSTEPAWLKRFETELKGLRAGLAGLRARVRGDSRDTGAVAAVEPSLPSIDEEP